MNEDIKELLDLIDERRIDRSLARLEETTDVLNEHLNKFYEYDNAVDDCVANYMIVSQNLMLSYNVIDEGLERLIRKYKELQEEFNPPYGVEVHVVERLLRSIMVGGLYNITKTDLPPEECFEILLDKKADMRLFVEAARELNIKIHQLAIILEGMFE